jgi:catechol 2,3-dioxygenase-like lactoylglutathione lyase family enzyme
MNAKVDHVVLWADDPVRAVEFYERVVGLQAALRFFIDSGAELIILWFQDLADVGSGTSQAERFMERVAPALRAR